MATDKAAIIESLCNGIARSDEAAVATALKEYPFTLQANPGRSNSPLKATLIFVRDGFIDRYSGARLVHPAVLRLISKHLPQEFPFHPNWKMTETHPAYWDLAPTIDHVIPVARGGSDSEENCITTSMLRNAAKANSNLDDLGWALLPPGDFSKWDGLTRWMFGHIERHGIPDNDPYILRWYKAACEVCGLTSR